MKQILILTFLAVALLCTSLNSQVPTPETKKEQYMVLQFSASWCPPCVRLTNLVKDVEIQKAIKANMRGWNYIDIDSTDPHIRAWIQRARPLSVPTVVKYKLVDGKWVEVSRFMGMQSKAFLLYLDQ